MDSKTLNTRIRQRIDTTANWTTNSSTVLANGEIGFERTTNGEIKIKVGDGIHTWEQLSYILSNELNPNILIELGRTTLTQSQYEIANEVIPDYTVSMIETIEAPNTVINAYKDPINQYYLNSFDLPLTQYEWGAEAAAELVPDSGITNFYSLTNNFDITTFTPINSNENFYMLNLLEFNTTYYQQFITNLTPANAPMNWIIYQLKSNIIIEDNISLNNKNLATNQAIQRAINQAISSTQITTTNTIEENSTAIPTAGAVYSAISNIPSNNGQGTIYTAGTGIKIENNIISTIYGTTANEWGSYNFGDSISTLNINPATNLNNIFDEISTYEDFIQLTKIITEPELFTHLINNQFKIDLKLQNTNLITQIYTMATATQIANNNNNDDSTLIKTIENIEIAENMTLNVYYTGKTDAMAYYMSEGEENETEYNELTEIIDRICFATMDININGSHIYQFNCEIPSDIASDIEYFSIYKLNSVIQKLPSNALSADNGIKIGTNGKIELDYSSTKHIPYAALNGSNNTDIGLTTSHPNIDNLAEAIVLGSNNSYLTKGNKMLIIGDYNDIDNTEGYSNIPPSLIVGNHLLDQGGCNFLILLGEYNTTSINSSIGNGTPYLIIGNGNNNLRSNILEITSQGVNINGDLYIQGNAVITSSDLSSYVQKDGNKILSDNNFTTAEQTKLFNLPSITTIGTGLTLSSGTLSASFSGSYTDLTNKPSIPTKVSDLTNDSNFITSSSITDKPSRASYTNGNLAIWNSSGNLADSGYQIVVSDSTPIVNNQNVITFVT